MQQKDHVQSLELLLEARQIAKVNNWHQQSFLAQNNIGNNYYMLLDYGEALKHYLESYKIADAYLDDKQKMIVLNNIAILYSKEKNYSKANVHFSKALAIAEEHNDSLKMAMYNLNMGILSNEENNLPQARMRLNRALSLTKASEILIPTKAALYTNDLLSGKTGEARTKSLALLQQLSKVQRDENRMDLMTIIAKSYLIENDLAKALQWTNATFDELPDQGRKAELYQLLATIYYQLKSYSQAFQYKDSVLAANMKLNSIKNSKLFESSEVKFQVQNYKEKIAEKEIRLQNERNFFYSTLIVIFLIVVIILLITRNYFIKLRQKQVMASTEQQLMAVKLDKEITENSLLIEKEKTAILEKQRLENEIGLRNQRILSKELYHSGRNHLLQDILISLSEFPTLTNDSALMQKVHELKDFLKLDDDWENYVRHFDEVNQGFIKRLTAKHPDLTTTDLRYISYLYMNLETKEIAVMLNITVAACRKRKERIEKRLQLDDQITLSSYLAQL